MFGGYSCIIHVLGTKDLVQSMQQVPGGFCTVAAWVTILVDTAGFHKWHSTWGRHSWNGLAFTSCIPLHYSIHPCGGGCVAGGGLRQLHRLVPSFMHWGGLLAGGLHTRQMAAQAHGWNWMPALLSAVACGGFVATTYVDSEQPVKVRCR